MNTDNQEEKIKRPSPLNNRKGFKVQGAREATRLTQAKLIPTCTEKERAFLETNENDMKRRRQKKINT